MNYSNEEKINMLACQNESGKNSRAATRLYKNRYPDHPCPAHSLFSYLCKNLLDFGGFQRPKHRICTVTNEDNSLAVLAKFNENPQISLRAAPSKSHYNKTGGGEKQDEECIDQADEQLLDILGHTAIHGHDTVNESTCTISFLSDNIIATNTVDIKDMIPANMPAEEDSNVDFITVSVNSNNSDEQDGNEKAIESDAFDQFIGIVQKNSVDKEFKDVDSQNIHNK
ncbi:hypothetical protein ACI65C_003949 [Semiaphis heraclei]